ncbi:MAG: hypothetical protein ACI9VM_000421 [Candidatus Azotimanducaceae bacterium]
MTLNYFVIQNIMSKKIKQTKKHIVYILSLVTGFFIGIFGIGGSNDDDYAVGQFNELTMFQNVHASDGATDGGGTDGGASNGGGGDSMGGSSGPGG